MEMGRRMANAGKDHPFTASMVCLFRFSQSISAKSTGHRETFRPGMSRWIVWTRISLLPYTIPGFWENITRRGRERGHFGRAVPFARRWLRIGYLQGPYGMYRSRKRILLLLYKKMENFP